jgi:hypothetical protein
MVGLPPRVSGLKAVGLSPSSPLPLHRSACRVVPRCFGLFLKELVKRKRFSSGLLRSGSAGRTLRSLRVGRGRGFLHAACSLVVLLRLGCRRFAAGSCHRSFRGDCSQHIPSRGTTHDSREQLRRAIGLGRRGFISCEFLTVRATPSKATCCWPDPLRARTAGVVGSKVSKFTLPTRGRTASAQRGPSFTDTKAGNAESRIALGVSALRTQGASACARMWMRPTHAALQLLESRDRSGRPAADRGLGPVA